MAYLFLKHVLFQESHRGQGSVVSDETADKATFTVIKDLKGLGNGKVVQYISACSVVQSNSNSNSSCLVGKSFGCVDIDIECKNISVSASIRGVISAQ